ncbi:MAG: cell division protein SepF [Mycoplasmatales bacterium]
MIKNLKNIFSEETEILDTQEINEMDESFDVEEISKPVNSKGKSIVKIYEPVTKTSTSTIIDSIKRGEFCIVNFSKVSEDEARNIYATLSGSLYSLEGQLKQINDNIIVCSPSNFLIDGELSD